VTVFLGINSVLKFASVSETDFAQSRRAQKTENNLDVETLAVITDRRLNLLSVITGYTRTGYIHRADPSVAILQLQATKVAFPGLSKTGHKQGVE